MHIAVIGTGGIGTGLASLFARHGHSVIFGSRDPDRAAGLLREVPARMATYSRAAEEADLVCFGVPWEHHEQAMARLGDLSGKILLDPSNPETPDGRSLALGHSTSGAEILAALAPGAKVVKAFNYLYAELLRDQEALELVAPSIFLCGDDAGAKETVSSLVSSCRLEPVDCGALDKARYLEPLALLMVQLVRTKGWGPAEVGMRLAHGHEGRA